MQSTRRVRWVFAPAWIVTAAAAAAASYYGMLAGFSSWDDEGNLMMTVRQYLEGGTLYRNVSTGYGPVYYFYCWLVRTVTSSAATHDSTRITAAVVWTLCAFGAAAIVWKFGRSLGAAAIAFALIFRELQLFRNEPGHPQELCMMLLLGAVAAFAWCDDERWRPRALAIGGALTAALLLVKINIGLFVGLAIALAVLGHLRGQWLWRVALLGAAALPAVLMRRNALDPREIAYAFAVTAGIAALAARPAKRPLLSWRDVASASGGFLVLLALALAVCAAKGITLRSMLDSLVLQQWRIRVGQLKFFYPAHIAVGWLIFALASVAAAAWTMWKGRDPQRLSTVIGAAGLIAAVLPGNQALAVITPWCWLVAYRYGKRSLSLMLLASAATLQTLYAYPVAGSQAPFAQVLLIVVAAVMISNHTRSVAFPAVAMLALAVWAWQAKERYDQLTPLDLPGATLVRVDARQAAEYRWVARTLRQHCDTFIGYPGMPSFYAWTGLPMPGPANEPPGPLSADSWTLWLTPAEQEAVVRDFARRPNACVLYNPAGVAFWNRSGEDESGQPLVRFIRDNFRTVDHMGDFQLQFRNERRR